MMFDTKNRAKPLLKWAGGKSSLLQELIARFPENFGTYLEPFFGGGAVFFSLIPGTPAIISDFNAELVHLYRVCRDFPEDLMKALDTLASQYSEEFYYELRKNPILDPIIAAARTVFLNKTGYNGLYRQNSQGLFNVPFGKRSRCPLLYNRSNILQVSERLKRAELHIADFEVTMDLAGPGDLIYCDPPYVPLSNTSNFNSYVGKGFGNEDQARLKEACVRAVGRGAYVVVSNSASELVGELFQGWKIETVKARRAINSQAELRGPISEYCIVLEPKR